jgi:hypothetical protein
VTDDHIFYDWPGVSNFEEDELILEKLLQLLSKTLDCETSRERVELRSGNVIWGTTFSGQLFDALPHIIFAMSNVPSGDVIQQTMIIEHS